MSPPRPATYVFPTEMFHKELDRVRIVPLLVLDRLLTVSALLG